MSHPSEALLLAFADDELDDERRREVDGHVRVCGLCRHALRDLEQAMSGLTVELALLDTAEPAGWQSLIVPREARLGRSASVEELPAATAAPRRTASRTSATAHAGRPTRTFVPLRWAAALLLVVGGGAAAMAVPRWRGAAAHLVSPTASVPEVRAVASTAVADVAMSSAAVSILPSGGEATVALTSTAGGGDGRVLVEVSDRSDVQVTVSTATSERMTPRFTSADGRLGVQLAGHGSLVRVALPATLRSARITHDGATIVTISGDAITPTAARTSGVILAGMGQRQAKERR